MKPTVRTWDNDNVYEWETDRLESNNQLENVDDPGDAPTYQNDIDHPQDDGFADENRAHEERLSFIVDQLEICEDPGDRITLRHDVEICNSFGDTDRCYFETIKKMKQSYE